MDRDPNNQMRLNGVPVNQSGFGKRGLAGGGAPARAPSPWNAADPTGLSPQAQQVAQEYRAERAAAPEIDFTVHGHDMQYVEIELDPGEGVIAENGAMIWKDHEIELAMVMGDGVDDGAGVIGKAGSALRTGLAGESLMMSQFTHTGSGKARLALGGQKPGQIAAIRLEEVGGTLVCRRDAFLAAAKGARLDMQLQRRLTSGLLGGEGMMLQTISGTGWVFIHVGGNLIERELGPADMIHVDSGCHVAHMPGVDMNIRMAGGIGVIAVGGEGLLMTTLRGPGRVWMQTLQPRPCAPAISLGDTTGKMAEGVGEGIAEAGFEFVKKLF